MKNGAIIFAHNNTGIDYTKLAVFSAMRVKEYLDIPVSIITDNPQYLYSNYPNHPFDQVITTTTSEIGYQRLFYDGSMSSKKLEWKNLTRHQVYDLTPYDKTLVLDSDYVVCSSNLKLAFERDEPFQIFKDSLDISYWRDTTPYHRVNTYSIPFYWATVFVFSKDPTTRAFFDLVTYIKHNWLYFRILYSIDQPTFRNDFAFSIAINIMNGKMEGDFALGLPGKMCFIEDKDVLLDIKDDAMKFLLQKKEYLGQYTAAKTTGLDIHVMNKPSLLRIIDGYFNV
jgi:hypothetical protein